jgi:hypothetical protein
VSAKHWKYFPAPREVAWQNLFYLIPALEQIAPIHFQPKQPAQLKSISEKIGAANTASPSGPPYRFHVTTGTQTALILKIENLRQTAE